MEFAFMHIMMILNWLNYCNNLLDIGISLGIKLEFY